MDYTNNDRQLKYRCVEIKGGNIDEVIEQLTELRIKAAQEPGFNGLIDVRFREYECEADWKSLETDEELRLRTDRVQIATNNRRKEYKKLKLEFEGEDWSGAQGNLSGFNWKMGDGKDL